MKTFKITLIALLLIVACANLQAQSKIFKATPAQMTALKKQADAMTAAMMHQDFKQMIYYTHPKIILGLGGKDNALKKLEGAMGQMQSQGIAFKSVSVGDIKSIVKSNGDLYSVVPDIIQVMVNGGVVTRGSSLLAISSDNGKRWYFVDTAPFKHQSIKKLFPTYPDGLVIPETGQ